MEGKWVAGTEFEPVSLSKRESDKSTAVGVIP